MVSRLPQATFWHCWTGERCQLALIETADELRTGCHGWVTIAIPPQFYQVALRSALLSNKALVDQVAHLLRMQSYELVTINGSVPDLSCADLLSELVKVCHAAQVPVWVDSYGPAMDTLLSSDQLRSWLNPNRQEYDSS